MADGLTSMELDDDEKIDFVHPIDVPSPPDFPYGLQICLTEKEFRKLKLDPKQAEKGAMVDLHARARITSVMHSDNETGETHRVELQIEQMSIDSEDVDDEGKD